ncbi:hypothetical protein [Amycolatopsis anabasis]|uniref:hypothetical protein n=1 Tax=Amycolatopsis anabasis TaxID=1840409 RepID=UPI00131DE456|nr:hypothetical protein [Amycolatopsis anabasis]
MVTDTVADGPVTRVRAKPIFRWFAREGPLVVFAGLALSAIFNWPIVRHPKSTVLGGIGDPNLQAWELAWQHHFLTAGGDFWSANMFYPAKDTFAFTDSLLGYFPLALFGDGQYAAILRYNIAYLLAFALAFVGCYLLARQLGGTWQAAALAGVVFAWAPWRLAHNSHLNVLSVGGIALALFALARGHGYSFRSGLRPERARPWWAFAGWLLAAWQVCLGFAVGIPFVYVMGLVGLVIAVVNGVRRRQLGRRVNLANGAGMVVFLGVTYLLTIPYRRVVETYHFGRSAHEVEVMSPPPQGLLTAHGQSWLWQGTVFDDLTRIPEPAAGEKLLFPGLVVLVLALAGLVVSAWPVRVRIGLAAGAAVATVLALGTNFFGGGFTYLLLWNNLPGWEALRTPGRLILWTILLLALLAAGAVTRLSQVLAERGVRKRLAAFVLVLPVLGALLEGVPDQSHATPPGIPPGLRQVFAQTRDPILILPIDTFGEFNYLLWSTEGFPRIANGNSGNFPPQYEEIVAASQSFPDAHSIAVLEKYGIRKVAVLKVAAASSPYAEVLRRPVDRQRLTRDESADVVVFTLT